ncbi:hypothetical protein QN345_00570 [Cryobacterium sp. 10I1]|uniref:hypothetical protein n=1 Tax=Cryobacterium sp. 10I1 TaxID=3048578 RepID=UPI002B23C820|nr:hypothetical protein [Cryobacterium sp. 10I1]MEB0303833.1 hypothetical protein [Cryobacterium sp. 10I1]
MSAAEVELVGGPRDGERRVIPDVDVPEIAFTGPPTPRPANAEGWVDITAQAPRLRDVYRRRLGLHPFGVRFDFQYPGSKEKLA